MISPQSATQVTRCTRTWPAWTETSATSATRPALSSPIPLPCARRAGSGVVQAAVEPVMSGRAVEVVLHVLFPGPQHLHRRAQLHRGLDRVLHEVRAAAPAPTAAQELHVNRDGVDREPGDLCRRALGALRVLGRSPDLAAV